MDQPLRPSTLPGERPLRPDGNRPLRPGNNRPINVGDINIGNNTVISNRPAWANIDRNRVTNINSRWQNQIGGMHNWPARYPARIDYWQRRGDSVRNRWHHHHYDWFGPSWWNHHQHHWAGWHYGYGFGRHPWGYWWTAPTFVACTRWFRWTTPPAVWAEPVYYDYGTGGNVVYQDNSVYIDGQAVATADEFAQTAMDLATVEPPQDEAAAEQAEWMPLGTFAVNTDEQDVEPTRVMQLAVNRDGVISGTMYNSKTDQAYTIQGQVDKQTQRVAFRVGDSDKIVLETGLYNLTQNEAPLLVHYGTDKVENWLLVRLPEPDDSQPPATP